MERSVKVETVYRTSDGRTFSGKKNSKEKATMHQKELDERLRRTRLYEKRLADFDTFMRELLGIKSEYNPDEYPEEEEDFCQAMMREVAIYADDGDFRGEVSKLLLDLYIFLGPDKWLKIYDFLVPKEREEL